MSSPPTRRAWRRLRPFGVAAPFLLIAACQERAPLGTDGPSATIAVAPLQLAAISKACWDLRISTDTATVWSAGRPGQAPADKWPADTGTICSDRYGNGAGGAIAYIGPCDASVPDGGNAPAKNSVTIWLDGLYGASGADIGGWVDPCPDGCTASFDCLPNADTRVELNLTIMREANQGFFDIAVNFEDVFCSAKLDCKDALLHNGPQRDTTVVLAFACTAGPGGESTTLYLNDALITCAGDPGAAPPIAPRTYTVPTHYAQAGNHGPLLPGVFEHATYFGREELPGYDKCYWNTAIGLDLTRLEPACTLTLRGTASGRPFTTPPFFHSPPDTIYPVVTWNVPLTDADGRLTCGAHPLNGGLGVETSYTTFSGEQFLNAYACGDAPETSRMICDGVVPGVGEVVVGATGGNVSVTANGHTAYYPPLPAHLRVDSCCPDACCAERGAR